MELKLSSPQQIKVVYGEASYMVSKPKMGQLLEFEKKKNEMEASNGGISEAVVAFLEVLGLPREVTLDLDSENVGAVVEALTAGKKN